MNRPATEAITPVPKASSRTLRSTCRRDAPIPEDPECRGFHRRLARMDRRMERLEEILTDRV